MPLLLNLERSSTLSLVTPDKEAIDLINLAIVQLSFHFVGTYLPNESMTITSGHVLSCISCMTLGICSLHFVVYLKNTQKTLLPSLPHNRNNSSD